MKEHQENIYSERERIRLKDKAKKYELLSSVKKESMLGPYTSLEEIDTYITNSDEEDNQKNKRMARMTSTSLKSTNTIFRLKKSYTNLSTEEYVDNLSAYLLMQDLVKTLQLRT